MQYKCACIIQKSTCPSSNYSTCTSWFSTGVVLWTSSEPYLNYLIMLWILRWVPLWCIDVMHWYWWCQFPILYDVTSFTIAKLQVGEMRRDERNARLQERYFFTCACLSCKTVAQPDVLLFAFRCSEVGCDGVVPGPSFLEQPDERVARDDSMQVSRFRHLETHGSLEGLYV